MYNNYVSNAPLAPWEIAILKTKKPFRVFEKSAGDGVANATRWEEFSAGLGGVLVVRRCFVHTSSGGAWQVESIQRAEYGCFIEGAAETDI